MIMESIKKEVKRRDRSITAKRIMQSFKVSIEDKKRIKLYAANEGLDKSSFIRKCIEEYIDRNPIK
jgi:predicted DNA-binding protein